MITIVTITAMLAALITSTLWIRKSFLHSEAIEQLRDAAANYQELSNKMTSIDKKRIELEVTLRRTRDTADADIKSRDDSHRQLVNDLRDTIKEQREKIKGLVAYQHSILNSDLVGIKFTAHVPDKGWTRTEFKLGVGPCGKDVEALSWVEREDRYELVQTCTDGERKEFTYYKKDVSGRIERAYRVSNQCDSLMRTLTTKS